ncbi:transcriptional repressor MprA [Clostridiales bacterium CHKCI006]|nr:transcriptional repressor MprA [Clostridiales bacterium CHKCI006]
MNEMDIIHQLMRMLYLYKKETVMEKKHQSELSRRDLMLLEVIQHMNQCHPVKMSDISHYLDITPAAVSQSVRDFEKKGWVKRVTPENDRRSVYVNITADAVQLLKRYEAHLKENLKTFITTLGPEDAQAFVRIVEKGLQFMKEHQHLHIEEMKGDSNV